jgi:hypothetical protein
MPDLGNRPSGGHLIAPSSNNQRRRQKFDLRAIRTETGLRSSKDNLSSTVRIGGWRPAAKCCGGRQSGLRCSPERRGSTSSAPAETPPTIVLPVCGVRRRVVAIQHTRTATLEAARRPRVANRAAISRQRQFTNGKLLRSSYAFLVLPFAPRILVAVDLAKTEHASFGRRGSAQLRYPLQPGRP